MRPSSPRNGTIVNSSNTGAVPAQSGHREQVAVPVPALAALHHPAISGPMPGALRLWDNDVEGLTKGPRGREPEHALGARIPEADDALPIGEDNRVRCRLKHGTAQPIQPIQPIRRQRLAAHRFIPSGLTSSAAQLGSGARAAPFSSARSSLRRSARSARV